MKEVINLVLGPILTNTYILSENGHCLIIDPAANPNRIRDAVGDLIVDGICLTHGHFDHIQAVDRLVKMFHCDLYISKEDEEMLRDSKKNASDMMTPFTVNSSAIHYQDHMKIGNFEFDVIEASGHTKGSVLLVFDDFMFCGDVLFKEGIGRCDLYGGSFPQMRETLKKIASMDGKYKVYSGHGESTTLFDEFKNNPYFRDIY